MQPEGRTERLILRPLELADADGIQEQFPHWKVVRYLLNRVPWPYPPDGALQFCREVALPQMERGEAVALEPAVGHLAESADRGYQPDER